MGFAELFLIAVGLSMDAFAVAVCKGLGMKRLDARQALVIALFFGGFQALMPFLGWALGTQFESLITPVDHWIAFGLLAFIGAKMLRDAPARGRPRGPGVPGRRQARRARAGHAGRGHEHRRAGRGHHLRVFARGHRVSVALIGATAFFLSLVGVAAGYRFGARYEQAAGVAGGVVLILIARRSSSSTSAS